MQKARVSFLLVSILIITLFTFDREPNLFKTQTAQGGACCSQPSTTGPREMVFP